MKCLDKQHVINKLFCAYKQMLDSGEKERAKGMWRAIKLINKCAVFEVNHPVKFFIDISPKTPTDYEKEIKT